MNRSTTSTKSTKRTLTGPLTIGAIFLFGLIVLTLLLRAPRSSDPAPADAMWGIPTRSLRVISLNLTRLDMDRALEQINSAHADIVLLQGVRTIDVARIGEAIGMSRANQRSGDVFYPSQNFEGPATSFGNAIYARFPLYEGRSIPNRGGSFGVWCAAVIDDKKVMLASMRPIDATSRIIGTQDVGDVRERELSMLARAHHELGDPPIIIGGASATFDQRDRTAIGTLAQSLSLRNSALLIPFGWSDVQIATGQASDSPGITASVGHLR
jgi:hypothetical protein